MELKLYRGGNKMIDKVSLKKIITDFQKYSTNLMTTNYEESDVNFRRFKKFIDENELVNNIIMQKISGVTINYEDYLHAHNQPYPSYASSLLS